MTEKDLSQFGLLDEFSITELEQRLEFEAWCDWNCRCDDPPPSNGNCECPPPTNDFCEPPPPNEPCIPEI